MKTKKLFLKILSLSLILCLLFSGCAVKNEKKSKIKSEPQGFIHAEGKKLILDGEEIILKGVNAGGWLLTEDWLTPTSLYEDLGTENGQYELEKALVSKYGEEKVSELFDIYRDNWWSEADFKNISDIGFNMIRLPFGWKDLTDENGDLKSGAFDRLDRFVQNCEKYRLFVILDMHGAYGSQNGRHHSGDTTTGGDLFGNEKNESLTAALWKAIAEHYESNKWVAGYDLLNEPEGKPDSLTSKTQWDFYDRLYDEIRQTDSEHLIFMESCWDADHMPNPKDYGWENVAYEYHYYNWDNGNDLKSMKSYFKYKAKLEFKYNTLKYKVPVFIGEFTFFDNPDCWRYGLEFFEKHGMSWAMWTYKGCVSSNWVLYSGEDRALENIVTPQTDYERAKEIFNSVSTEQSFKPNEDLIKLIKEYL